MHWSSDPWSSVIILGLIWHDNIELQIWNRCEYIYDQCFSKQFSFMKIILDLVLYLIFPLISFLENMAMQYRRHQYFTKLVHLLYTTLYIHHWSNGHITKIRLPAISARLHVIQASLNPIIVWHSLYHGANIMSSNIFLELFLHTMTMKPHGL